MGPAICALFSSPGDSEVLNYWISEDPEELACPPETDLLKQDIPLDALWGYVPTYFCVFLPSNRVQMRTVGGGNHTTRVLSSVNLGTNYLR